AAAIVDRARTAVADSGDGADFFRAAPLMVSSLVDSASVQLGAALVDAEGGALVTRIVPGSGAADAGIKVGDLIQTIDGIDLSSAASPHERLVEHLAELEPGDIAELTAERAGEMLDFSVATAERRSSLLTALQPLQAQAYAVLGGESADGQRQPLLSNLS